MKLVISPGFEHLEHELKDIVRLFDSPQGQTVHQGRNTIRNFTLQGIAVTVKRFKRVNFFQQIAYTFFRSTKAERAFSYARIFRERGIPTPQEVAYALVYGHGLFTTGYFVSVTCPDPPAFPALVKVENYDKDLAAGLARFIAGMHRKGVVHGDLNLGNFLYRKNGESYSFTAIDINRSRFYGSLPPQEICVANLRTVTHRRDLFGFIVKEYAVAMGWYPLQIEEAAEKQLRKMEIRHSRKQRIKNLFK